tara:strand:- start:470 stop:646 length:177 start_codon:yes stop_codon:yes gene_type:complete
MGHPLQVIGELRQIVVLTITIAILVIIILIQTKLLREVKVLILIDIMERVKTIIPVYL